MIIIIFVDSISSFSDTTAEDSRFSGPRLPSAPAHPPGHISAWKLGPKKGVHSDHHGDMRIGWKIYD